MSICKAFLTEDPRAAYQHIRNNYSIQKRYGDYAYGHYLYTWDEGYRVLSRCSECGAFILVQVSEFHSFTGDDSYYTDYFPVDGPEEAEKLNRDYNGFEIETKFPHRYLMETNSHLSWSNGSKPAE